MEVLKFKKKLFAKVFIKFFVKVLFFLELVISVKFTIDWIFLKV